MIYQMGTCCVYVVFIASNLRMVSIKLSLSVHSVLYYPRHLRHEINGYVNRHLYTKMRPIISSIISDCSLNTRRILDVNERALDRLIAFNTNTTVMRIIYAIGYRLSTTIYRERLDLLIHRAVF